MKLVDRGTFAAAMARVRIGMTASEVVALIGKADDVWSAPDPKVTDLVGAHDIWRYGTNGPDTFATLGKVVIDDNGKVLYVSGGFGSPPARGMFNEGQLRSLLQLIDDAPQPWGGSDPRRLIRAVNAVQPLGKDRALTALAEYLRVTDEDSLLSRSQGFLILRALFELPPEQKRFPDLHVGSLGGHEISVPTPRYPLLIVGDVPFLMVTSWGIGGEPESVEEDLPYFRDHCQIRSAPLVPGNDPLAIYDKLLSEAPNWRGADDQRVLIDQLLRMVDTVYRPFGKLGPEQNCYASESDFDAELRRIRSDLGSLDLRWDPKNTRYVFAKDGSVLP